MCYDLLVDTNPTRTCMRSALQRQARGGCSKLPYHTGANQRVCQELHGFDLDFKSAKEVEAEEELRQ